MLDISGVTNTWSNVSDIRCNMGLIFEKYDKTNMNWVPVVKAGILYSKQST